MNGANYITAAGGVSSSATKKSSQLLGMCSPNRVASIEMISMPSASAVVTI